MDIKELLKQIKELDKEINKIIEDKIKLYDASFEIYDNKIILHHQTRGEYKRLDDIHIELENKKKELVDKYILTNDDIYSVPIEIIGESGVKGFPNVCVNGVKKYKRIFIRLDWDNAIKI